MKMQRSFAAPLRSWRLRVSNCSHAAAIGRGRGQRHGHRHGHGNGHAYGVVKQQLRAYFQELAEDIQSHVRSRLAECYTTAGNEEQAAKQYAAYWTNRQALFRERAYAPDPAMVGDEALMLRRKTACPMVVGPGRAAAVKAASARTSAKRR